MLPLNREDESSDNDSDGDDETDESDIKPLQKKLVCSMM